MLSIGYLFEKRKPYDGHGSFQDFKKMKDKQNAVEANKDLNVQDDISVNPIPASHRLQLKSQEPLKAKITVRMGVINQEN